MNPKNSLRNSIEHWHNLFNLLKENKRKKQQQLLDTIPPVGSAHREYLLG